MKKVFMPALILILSAVFLFPSSVFADNTAQLPYYVSDSAGLMTSEQWQILEDSASKISEQYGVGVYIVTLDDYRDYGSFSSFWEFSQQFYQRYNMGVGDQRNGILLIMSTADRDYSILAYGRDAHYAFTDYAKTVLEDGFLDDFRRDDWYGGFKDYIEGCDDILARAAAGTPLDVTYEGAEEIPSEVRTGIVIGLPLLVGLGACEGMRRQMKPVKKQSRADEYIVPGGIRFSQKRDTFINRTVTRTLIRSENRDSSSGGGTSINSSGFSGHSGKF